MDRQSRVNYRLKVWGEWECEVEDAAMEIDGHTISNMRVEQTYKGNYHLLASIDGVERKFVINKKNADFAYIEQIGLANLTTEYLKTLVEKCFNL